MSFNQGFWLKASASAPLTQGRRVENLCCLLWSARGGVKSSIQCGPNPHSLPDWTWELLRNVTLLSSQSCQRVYCMTILQEEIWCFVNFELCELCSCDRAQPSPSPAPAPPQTSWPKSEYEAPAPVIIYDIWLPILHALWACEIDHFKNGCCGDCVWYLLLLFVFLMLCFYAAFH